LTSKSEKIIEIRPRIALALSGGGFRASIFHLGVLRRLAEEKWLDKVDVISAVSGGSIVGAFAAIRWQQVLDNGGDWPALKEHIVDPFLLHVQKRNFIVNWSKQFPLIPFRKRDKTYTRTKLAARIFSKRFYAGKSCDDLPEKPLLIINATCLKSIRSWRFTRYGLGCSRIGHSFWEKQVLSIGECVGASAAFPPLFPPTRVDSDQYKFSGPLHKFDEPITLPKFIALSDGGVYENLGTEVLTKEEGSKIPVDKVLKQPEYLLVSDAGYPPQYRFKKSGIPFISEGLLLYRVDDIARTQVNALRLRNLIGRYMDPEDTLKGILVYLASNTDKTLRKEKNEYYEQVGDQHQIPKVILNKIQSIRTHLDRFSSIECEALMYHSYTLTDTAIWNFRYQNPPAYRVSDKPGPKWKIEFTKEKVKKWDAALTDSNKRRILRPR